LYIVTASSPAVGSQKAAIISVLSARRKHETI
jgi:hypothetical protein